MQLREHDKKEVVTPLLRELGGHFGRCRTSLAIILALCLWVSKEAEIIESGFDADFHKKASEILARKQRMPSVSERVVSLPLLSRCLPNIARIH